MPSTKRRLLALAIGVAVFLTGLGVAMLPQVSAQTTTRQNIQSACWTTYPSPPIKPLEPPIPLPGTGGLTFSETGKTVSAAFLSYWNKNGGLPQQGYPISNILGEVSPLNDMTYTMQYFERAVFEYHPEQKPPYNVLLSQLGTFQYKKKYPTGAPGQRPNNDPGSIFFPQTGRRVGGSFLQYWQRNGGLAQQGYPLSDEFTEVSDLNGKPYTVQYFERAVFEWHPENAPPYNVLLSQLGKFRYDACYSQPAATSTVAVAATTTPSRTPTASATPTQTASPQLIARDVYGNVAVSDRYLFWISSTPDKSIYGYDLEQNRRFLITSKPGEDIYRIASDGKTVAWTQGQNSIRGYDLSAGAEFPIVEVSGDRRLGPTAGIALYNGVLYYADVRDPTQTPPPYFGSIYSFNLATKEGEKLIERGNNPVVADGVMVWSDTQPSYRIGPQQTTVYARKLDGSMKDTALVSDLGGSGGYSVSGDNVAVAFTSFRSPEYGGARVHNLSSGTSKVLSQEPVEYPIIRGSAIVWTNPPISRSPGQSSGFSISKYNLNTGQVSTVVPESDTQLYAQGITEKNQLVYTTGGPYQNLYISPLDNK